MCNEAGENSTALQSASTLLEELEGQKEASSDLIWR